MVEFVVWIVLSFGVGEKAPTPTLHKLVYIITIT